LGTIESNAHGDAIKGCAPEVNVFGQSCPLFVNLVEEGKVDERETWEVAEHYLGPLKMVGIDTLILGCTHFPHLRPIISSVMGDNVVLLDPAEETVKSVAKALGKMGKLNYGKKAHHDRYWVTDDSEKFRQVGQKLLNVPLQVESIKFWGKQKTVKD
jgi:glutamate racemase